MRSVVVKIDKNIPIPEAYAYQEMFKNMVPGDSILIPCKLEDSPKVRSNLSNSARRFRAKNPSFSYTTRIFGTGVRFWRLEDRIIKSNK